MKIRNGFVSNSSSSSFILFKAYLTPEQIKQIRNWDSFCLTDEYKEMLNKYDGDIYPHNTTKYEWDSEGNKRTEVYCEPFSEDDFAYYPEGWEVKEGPNVFDFYTDMDNFDMEQFLKVIGVDIDKCGLWTEYSGSHRSILGLNDSRTDLQNYVNDKYFMDDYDNNYYYTSKLYKEKIYPALKEWYDRQPDNKFKGWPPHPPIEPKKWICEDAGQALNEVESRIRKQALDKGVFYIGKMSNGQYHDYRAMFYAEIIDIINEVKDNWRATDEYEENAMKEDDSQRVMAALEGQGYFNREDEEAYRESVDRLYDKPLGVNINDIVKED